MNKFYALIVVFFVILSCQQKQEKMDKTIIPVAETVGTGEILNLSDYAKSVEYIPLETDDSILIGNIEQVVYEKGHIILYDSHSKMCKIFMNDGRFKTQLGQRGQGPEEYQSIHAMSFIFSSNEVFIDTYPRHYYIYDLNGNLRTSMQYIKAPEPFRVITTVALTPDLYFSHLNAKGDFRYRGLAWGQKDTAHIYKLFPHNFEYDKSNEITSISVSTQKWQYKDELRCFWEEKDTIFTINSDLELRKAFVLDLGKYKESFDVMFLGGRSRHAEANKSILLLYKGVSESSRYLFLKFNFKDIAPEAFTYMAQNPRGGTAIVRETYVYGLFDKGTGKLTLLNQPVKHKYLGFKNDLDGGPCFWPNYVSSDDKMVTWWNAGDFLELYEKLPDPSPALKKVAEKLTPDDNPVLMVVTLK